MTPPNTTPLNEEDKLGEISGYRCLCKYKVEIDGHARVIGVCVCSEDKKRKAREIAQLNTTTRSKE